MSNKTNAFGKYKNMKENEKLKWLFNQPEKPYTAITSKNLEEAGYVSPNIKQPNERNTKFNIKSALLNGNTSAVQTILKNTKKINSHRNPSDFYETETRIRPMSFTNQNNNSKQKQRAAHQMNIYKSERGIQNNEQIAPHQVSNNSRNMINFSNKNKRELERIEQEERFFNKYLKKLRNSGKIRKEELTSLIKAASEYTMRKASELTNQFDKFTNRWMSPQNYTQIEMRNMGSTNTNTRNL
jgi:hypothetical protein